MDHLTFEDILIVEDNPTDAELTLRAFKKVSLPESIYVAIDGEEALDYLFCRGKHSQRNASRSLRAVFLDLNLPKISGLEVLKELKSHSTTKNTPVIVISSSNEYSDIQKAYELGANSYVVKPVEYDEFTTALASVGRYWLLVNEKPK